MFKVGLKGLLAHKRRLLGTCSAILIGVAFLSATLILGDTMRAGFKTIFSQANENVAVIVRGSSLAESDEIQLRANVPLSLLSTLEGVDGVAEVVPEITGQAQINGSNGKPLGGGGPPTFGAAWSDSDTNPYRVAEGRAPATAGEVVINKSAGESGKLAVGDTTTIRTPDSIEVTIVGLVTFGQADSVGGATYAGFTFDQAQELFIGNTDQVSDFALVADAGVSPDELETRLGPVLPEGVEAITSEELTKEQQGAIDKAFLDFFERFLLIFSGIALIVACFSIYNTFSVILAQRTRESALLRAIGASRRQVLSSMAIEALVVGLVASILGLVVGIGLATLLKGAMDASGSGLPSSGVDLTPRSLILALVAGIVITFLASVIPSIRASGVPPLAALRDVSVDRSAASRARVVVGGILAVLGVGLVLLAALGGGDSSLANAGLGALLCVIALVVLGPLAAKPGGSAIGLIVQKLRGLPGRLARENSVRNPKRTSSTAAALMVGVAIVAMATIFASSIKASFNELIGENLSGDLFVVSTNFGGVGFSPDLATDVAELPEVEHAAGATIGIATIDGVTTPFTSSAPAAFGAIVNPELSEGSIAGLTADQVAVARDIADRRGWTMGQQLPATFIDGTPTTFTIAGIYDRPELVGAEIFVPIETWAPHNPQLSDQSLFITLADGVSIEEGKAAVQPLADKYGAPDVMDRQEYIDLFSSSIDIFLIIVNVLLFLSIIIAVMGIMNTLALSIYERTRELGLLRAVGQTRAQMRSMIRWESAVIAIFGTFGGLVAGLFLGWGFMKAFSNAEGFGTFTAPVGQLITILILGGLFGMLAGVLPARRAAKLDILDSIAADG